jgi:hypothetical protein
MKKFMFILFTVVITYSLTTSAVYSSAKQRSGPRVTGGICVTTASVTGMAYDPNHNGGEAFANVFIKCFGTTGKPCVPNVVSHLWHNFPYHGWDTISVKCVPVNLPCSGTTNLLPSVKNMLSGVPGDYYFEVDVIGGTCDVPGSVISWQGIYFSVP